MNRLGWIIAAALLIAVALFALLLNVEPSPDAPPAAVPPPQIPVVRAPAAVTPSGLAIPVAGASAAQLVDTWGQARSGGRSHEAIDIMAPRGTPVVAAMPGTVEKLFLSDAGGITAYVRSPDGKWMAYYAHLDAYAEGLAEGRKLRRGDPIGTVGDTGNAGAGNTHLHFALHRMQPGEGWWEGTPVNPYPILAGAGASR